MRSIPPGTAFVRYVDCPICFAANTIRVREWTGELVSVCQGEAMTNQHYRVDADCRCVLNEGQTIAAFHEAQKKSFLFRESGVPREDPQDE